MYTHFLAEQIARQHQKDTERFIQQQRLIAEAKAARPKEERQRIFQRAAARMSAMFSHTSQPVVTSEECA